MSIPWFSPTRLAIASGALLVTLAPSATAVAHTAQLPSPASTSELSAMTCPVDGESTFIDSWGATRSGGRRHQGVDLIADRGTPVIAAAAGYAEFKTTRAGGKSVWLVTPSGDRFFYAHLADWDGDSRDVERGEVIGYVGSTGNAQGPHLHFEVHPDGTATNPFPLTDHACGEDPVDDVDEDRIETSDVIPDLGLRAR